jgi:hypothetical protein
MFGLLRAALLLVLLSCLLAGVSNAKLYRPVSQPIPSAHDDECHKKRGKKTNQEKNQKIIAQRPNSLACSLDK